MGATAARERRAGRCIGTAALRERGSAYGQFQVASGYLVGEGVPQDVKEAEHWLRKAAEQGHAQAQYELAVLYLGDRLGDAQPVQALHWFRRAAAQQDARAWFNLAVMAENGEGQIATWLRRSGGTARRRRWAVAPPSFGWRG